MELTPVMLILTVLAMASFLFLVLSKLDPSSRNLILVLALLGLILNTCHQG